MIEFKNVQLNINNIDISNDISFCIEDNTTTLILGNKNSGKSSILKMLAGIYKSYTGEILIDGINVKDKRYKNNKNAKKVAIINDKVEADPDINVLDYLTFYGSLYNTLNEKDLLNFIDEKLKSFSLMSYKYTNITQLDKENFKFIEIIRILIYDPDIILFDNLFFGDNVEYFEKMYEFIKTLTNKKTLIFASRNTNYIESICDNIGILDSGVLIILDKKEKVYKFADIVNKFEIKVIDSIDKAVALLNANNNVINISYDDNTIIFSLASNDVAHESKFIESEILNDLVNNGIKVYSYRKRQVRYEQLFNN